MTLVRHPVSKMFTFMKNRVESGYNYSALLVYKAIIDFGTICIGTSHGRALSHHSFLLLIHVGQGLQEVTRTGTYEDRL